MHRLKIALVLQKSLECFLTLFILVFAIRGVRSAQAETLWFQQDTVLMGDPDSGSDEVGLAPKTSGFVVGTEAVEGGWVFGRVVDSNLEGWAPRMTLVKQPLSAGRKETAIIEDISHHLTQKKRLTYAIAGTFFAGTSEFVHANGKVLNQIYGGNAQARLRYMFVRNTGSKIDIEGIAGMARERDKRANTYAESTIDFTSALFGLGVTYMKTYNDDFGLGMFGRGIYYLTLQNVSALFASGTNPDSLRFEIGPRVSLQPISTWSKGYLEIDIGIGISKDHFYGLAGLALAIK